MVVSQRRSSQRVSVLRYLFNHLLLLLAGAAATAAAFFLKQAGN